MSGPFIVEMGQNYTLKRGLGNCVSSGVLAYVM